MSDDSHLVLENDLNKKGQASPDSVTDGEFPEKSSVMQMETLSVNCDPGCDSVPSENALGNELEENPSLPEYSELGTDNLNKIGCDLNVALNYDILLFQDENLEMQGNSYLSEQNGEPQQTVLVDDISYPCDLLFSTIQEATVSSCDDVIGTEDQNHKLDLVEAEINRTNSKKKEANDLRVLDSTDNTDDSDYEDDESGDSTEVSEYQSGEDSEASTTSKQEIKRSTKKIIRTPLRNISHDQANFVPNTGAAQEKTEKNKTKHKNQHEFQNRLLENDNSSDMDKAQSKMSKKRKRKLQKDSGEEYVNTRGCHSCKKNET